MKNGDIVLLRDSNCFKRGYRLAKVSEASPGSDGKVRRITVTFKNVKDSGVNVKQASQTLKSAQVKKLKLPFKMLQSLYQ